MPVQLNITLRQMRAFVTAYRLRNLTHAADAMSMTQSAMSAMIRQFEESLGLRLFERTPRVLRPTKAAEKAFAQVEAILDKVNALGSDMQDLAEVRDRVLSFSCAPALSSGVVPTVLAKLQRLAPEVRIVMYDAGDTSLIKRVLDEEAEFSLGFFEHEPEAVSSEPLVMDHLSVVCRADSALANKDRVVWEDLISEPMINLSKGVKVQHLIAEAISTAGRAYRPAYEISFIHTALALAAQGMGLVVLPGYLIKGNPHVGTLVAKKLHEPVIERSLLVHMRQGHTLSPVALEFLEMLKDHLASLS
jgi:LysR family transcriptional regulator, carnitine catabolism transcriptional activator